MGASTPLTRLLAAAGLAVNALVWGLSWWPFRQLQTQGVHPLWATALFCLLCLCALVLLRPQAWAAFARHPALWLLALAAGLTNVGFNWAVAIGDVVRVVLLFYLMPAWSVLLAWPLLGERPSLARLLRLGLSLAGVVVVLKAPGVAWPLPQSLPDWLALMGGMGFALTNVLLRRLRATPPLGNVFALFAGGGLGAGLVAWAGMLHGVVPALPSPAVQWPVWILCLSVAFLAGNLGLQYGAARLPAGTTSLVMLLEVVFASASSVAMGAATLDMRMLVGGALILSAALLSALAPEEAAHSHAQDRAPGAAGT